MKTILHFVLGSIMLIACDYTSNSTKHQNKIYKIEFARCSTYGPSPFEAFSIDSTLSLKYHGVAFVDKYGYFEGKITISNWEALEKKCMSLLQLNSDTCWDVSDSEALQLIIYSNNGVQYFYGESQCLPNSLVRFCEWIKTMRGQTSLSETNEFSLETRLEKSYKGLPRDTNAEFIEYNEEIRSVEPDSH